MMRKLRLPTLMVKPLRGDGTASLLALILRLALAAPFYLSGRTKVAEGSLLTPSETTYFLFQTEYANIPLPPDVAAPAATFAEFLLPLLLLLGLGTRVAAAGLLGMTLMIQFFVYPDAWWNTHFQWTALALAVLALGPGRWSLDHLIWGRAGKR